MLLTAKYAKAIAALVGSVLTAVMAMYPNVDWRAIAVAALTPAAVAAIPNKQDPVTDEKKGVTP